MQHFPSIGPLLVTTREFNFDGLIGPTHNFAGLSFGNVASTSHQFEPSQPKAAALQGLQKMKFLMDLGVGQCVLPPLRRPRFEFLRQLGFAGTDRQLIERAYAADPVLLASCYSASNMWTANAATVSPSEDCSDNKLHITPANLSSTLHRAIEHPSTTRNLRAIFPNQNLFTVHSPLPSQAGLADEGAANHTRLCPRHGDPGIELFVYGVGRGGTSEEASDGCANGSSPSGPKKYPARQTLLASQSVARNHGVKPNLRCFVQQNPDAIDAGVFHNDVIAVGNENVLLCHESAFVDQQHQIDHIRKLYESTYQSPLHVIEFSRDEINLKDAVASYLFNSQLVTRPDGKMTLICPVECQENESAHRCTQRMVVENNPIDEVAFLDLRQSMNNGGGPACLRLRVVLTPEQQAAMNPGVVLTDQRYESLVGWVNANYRDQIVPEDLRDPQLVDESQRALERLAEILDIPAEDLLDH